MSETRDAFGPLLRQLQADMRSARAEQGALRDYIVSFVATRAAETENLIESLFDNLNRRLDQTERSIEERLARIESKLGA